MRTHVAFLRAINTGGRRLTMAELVEALAPAGLGDVATFQATGNVAFTADGRSTQRSLERRIETVLAEALGYDVPTIVRTAERVRAIAGSHPFSADQLAGTQEKVQVLFVRDEPDRPSLEQCLAMATDAEPLVWDDGELWWLPEAGVRTSTLDWTRVSTLLAPATMRTHRAVTGLASKLL